MTHSNTYPPDDRATLPDDDGLGMPVRILSWKPIHKGAVIGVADIVLGKALEIHGLLVMQANEKCWISFPGRPKFDFKTDLIHRDENGKIKYETLMSWTDKASSTRFKNAVLAAVAKQYGPEALAIGGAS